MNNDDEIWAKYEVESIRYNKLVQEALNELLDAANILEMKKKKFNKVIAARDVVLKNLDPSYKIQSDPGNTIIEILRLS